VSIIDWAKNAFFEDPEVNSLDGGTTSAGPLWHAISPRWGHSMHTMCSYHGMFPARLAHYFIHKYSHEGDVILDPFSGRGTTALQARMSGRQVIGNDLSPLAYVLTRAKANPPCWLSVLKLVDHLERAFNKGKRKVGDVSADIRMLFHERTLAQLVFIKEYLHSRPMTEWTSEMFMIAGSLAGIMHGSWRSDGTSQYLSISMPNTFSMSPSYVRKFIAEHGLEKIPQDVFERLRDKLARLYLDSTSGNVGAVFQADAATLMSKGPLKPGSVDLVVTSPPYLQVVNYGTANWIRLWLLGLDEVSRDHGDGRRELNAKLDHKHRYHGFKDFMLRTFKGIERVLKRGGVAVVVIGDVANPGDTEALALAGKVWEDLEENVGLERIEVIEDYLKPETKVSRIWGETKGGATNRDCALVLVRKGGSPFIADGDISWDEPYKDAGPDAAHYRLRELREAS
jgi:DNA modification methylase